ncbi:MAG: hypothetical protein NTX05_08865 [Fusobacteria bacterium]|nr:hypothetical protein [Fusobacteriota bacterium]
MLKMYCCECEKKIGLLASFFSSREMNYLFKEEVYPEGYNVCYKCGQAILKERGLWNIK